MRAMLDRRHDLTSGGGIGAEFVSDHAPGRTAVPFEKTPQQAPGHLGVAARLHDFIEDIAVLVDGAPQPVLLAADGDHDLIEVPDVAAARLLAPEAAGVIPPEFHRPASHRLVGDDDTTFQQHLLHQAQAQRETKIQPNRVSDDRRRKSMALVTDGRLAHASPSTRTAVTPRLT